VPHDELGGYQASPTPAWLAVNIFSSTLTSVARNSRKLLTVSEEFSSLERKERRREGK